MAQPAMKPESLQDDIKQNSSVIDLRSKSATTKPSPTVAVMSQTNDNLIEQLFVLEARIRDTENLQALKYFAANELRQLIPASQVMLFKRNTSKKPWVVDTVSSLAAPDDRSPLLQWLCRELECKTDISLSQTTMHLRFDTTTAPSNAAPFQYALFALLPTETGTRETAIIFFADRPFSDQHKNILTRLSNTLGHALRVFDRGKPLALASIPKSVKWILMAGILLVMFVPLPLTVLAPAEVVPDKPQIISAPISGVIKQIYVEPNQEVLEGTLLYSFDKTEAQNNLDQSNRSLLVAQSRFRRANQAAFGAGSLKSEMAVAKAEADLALSEQESYQRRLALADVYAPSDGIVLFESIDKWIGKPVETGERVMRIADPKVLSLKIDLATEDAILLTENARAKIFLDANPLNPFETRVYRTSYDAMKSERDSLVFPLYARLSNAPAEEVDELRIGLRGTAQLFGENVPLWFFLFRKPLSYLRQLTGF